MTRTKVYLTDGSTETFHSDIVADMFIAAHDVVRIEKTRVFCTEAAAEKFANNVCGKVKVQDLPGYMETETVYVVDWEAKR